MSSETSEGPPECLPISNVVLPAGWRLLKKKQQSLNPAEIPRVLLAPRRRPAMFSSFRSPIRDIVGAADEPVAGRPLVGPGDSPVMRDIPTRRRRTKQTTAADLMRTIVSAPGRQHKKAPRARAKFQANDRDGCRTRDQRDPRWPLGGWLDADKR